MKRILPMIFAVITLLSACGMNPPPGGTVPPSSGVSLSPSLTEAPVQSGEPQSGGDIDIPDTPYSYLAFENDWLTLRDAYTQAMEPYSVWHECNFDEGSTLLIEPKETLTGLSLYTMDMDSDGIYVRGETFCTLDELTPEAPLVLAIQFYGDMTAYGMSFTDGGGKTHDLTLTMGGRAADEACPYMLTEE